MIVYQDLHGLYNLVFREFLEMEKKTGRGEEAIYILRRRKGRRAVV